MPSIPDYVRGPGLNTRSRQTYIPPAPPHEHHFLDSGWCLYCPTHQDGRTA
jgi:hypothetical protein